MNPRTGGLFRNDARFRGQQLLPAGLHDFLRAYYHVKSADWPPNMPHPLAAMSCAELARLPTYYVMEMGKGMAETVAAGTGLLLWGLSSPWLIEYWR